MKMIGEESIQDKDPSWGDFIISSPKDGVFENWVSWFRSKNVPLQVVPCKKKPGTYNLQVFQRWHRAGKITHKRTLEDMG